MEYRRKCKVCGKIWCYTDNDLVASKMNSFSGTLSALGNLTSIVGGGSIFHSQYFADRADHDTDKVVNYEQCPNCRSLDTFLLTDEEWETAQVQESFANVRVSINANATTEALLTRIKLLLEDGDWPNANAYCDAVLDAEPENAIAYVYKLMAELRVAEQEDLKKQKAPFDTKPNYQKAIRFADDDLQQSLKGYIVHINERNEQERLKGLYDNACAAMQRSVSEEDYNSAAALLAAIKDYRDADSLQAECLKKAKQLRLEAKQLRLEADKKAAEKKAAAAERARKAKKIAMIAAPIVVAVIVAAVLISNHVKLQNAYNAALALVEAGQYDKAVATFTELGNFKDSAEQISETRYVEALTLVESGKYDGAIAIFTELGDYKDSAEQSNETLYVHALALSESGNYANAIEAFTELGDYKDSAERLVETRYTQAIFMLNLGKYDAAIAAFAELGDYKDSAEQLKVSFKKLMTVSIAGAYEQLQASTDDSEYIQELKAMCEPYIPYCGSFEGKDENYPDPFILTSDFFLYNNEICWKVEMSEECLLGIRARDDSSVHHFFVDKPDNNLIVKSSMEVTDEWKKCIGTATFKDGKIYIDVSYDTSTYYDVTYEKVS